MVIAVAMGVLIGLLLGLMGGGGSILAVPALVYALGIDITEAIPVSLIVVGVASAVGALPKVAAHQVQWRLAGIFAAAGIPATFVGAAIGNHLPPPAIMIGFAAVMVAAGWRMLADSADTGTACSVGGEGIDWRRCASRSIPAGFLVGLLTGLFGVGGGFLIIPALVVFLGVQMTTAIGTSLLIITANSAAGLFSHLHSVDIDWSTTAAFVGAAITASLIAGQIGTKVNTGRLQHWFAYLVFAVALYVVIDTVVALW
jgi:uncharacterized membrane protein YfcA